MKAIRGGALAGFAAVISGSFSIVVFAQDCWVCTSTCTEGEHGPCSGPEVTVCENGASPAQPGQLGTTQLQAGYHQKECIRYIGGTWFHSADCEPIHPREQLPCSTGTPGQCCIWSPSPGGLKVPYSVPVMIQRCKPNAPWCYGVADD